MHEGEVLPVPRGGFRQCTYAVIMYRLGRFPLQISGESSPGKLRRPENMVFRESSIEMAVLSKPLKLAVGILHFCFMGFDMFVVIIMCVCIL